MDDDNQSTVDAGHVHPATGMLAKLNAVAFWSYALFLLLPAGFLGLFVPRWGPMEFEVFARVIFKLDLSAQHMASVLNQYRFMKAEEFGFGLFAILFRREIFGLARFNRFFLGIVFLGAFERWLSIAVDGIPHPFYIYFACIETVFGLIMLLYSVKTLRAAA
jgi:hypothetical protein